MVDLANGFADFSDDYNDYDDLEIDENFLASTPMHAVFRAVPCLDRPTVPAVVLQTDPHTLLQIRTADLCNLGAVNGDWVFVEQDRRRRLARICVNEHIIEGGTVLLSPLFLHSLNAGRPYLTQRPLVSVHPTSFSALLPPVPIARSLTVARVASPHSVNRLYQPLFLHALKAYFDGPRRLLQEGDLLAIPVRTNDLQVASELQSIEDNNDDDLLASIFPLVAVSHTVTVFFVVTHMECEVISHEVANPDDYIAITVGELGCWVDPCITRILQTGVEHRLIPDVEYISPIDSAIKPEWYPSNTIGCKKLFELCSVALFPQAAGLGLPLTFLLHGPRGAGKLTAVSEVSRALGLHVLEANCFELIHDSDVKTETNLRVIFEKASACSPCMLVLRGIEACVQTTQTPEQGKEPVAAHALSDCIAELTLEWKKTGYPTILVGIAADYDRLPPTVVSLFKHELSFQAPNEEERNQILRSLLSGVALTSDVSIKSIATQTAALMATDLEDLVSRAKVASIGRSLGTFTSKTSMQLSAADLDSALFLVRESYAAGIGAPKIPSVSWDDVGGLASVKADILDTIQLPLEHPELFVDGLKKRSGLLLYGPPGTGKTLLAKAVATSCSLNFFSVKGPELLNMYIGESEANVRRVFQKARDARPCVIFFDELDSVAPKRGNHGDSGGVMDRIVSQLLAELDGIASGKAGTDVFVIGATNRPDLLDPALLRPGRFDRMLYLGVSSTHAAQESILEALTRKFTLGPDVDLKALVERCPFHYTGADLYALSSDALLKAMSRTAEHVDKRIADMNASEHYDHRHPFPMLPQYYLTELAAPQETDVVVTQCDFELALQDLIPSVSESEMAHYAAVQAKFANASITSKPRHDKNMVSSRKDKGKGRAL